MISWRPLVAERMFLYSPVGFRLVDDLSGQPPFGALDIALDVQDGTEWRPVDRDAVMTASGVIIFPGLGLTPDTTQPAQPYRIRLQSPYYRPLFRTEGGSDCLRTRWSQAAPTATPMPALMP